MSKTKLKIKEFSLLCQVTVKTLRHYEKIGLLKRYIDGAWNQEDPEKWVSLIQIPIE